MDARTVEGTMIEMMLRQIEGAKTTAIRGVLYFIEFEFDNNNKVSYVYNINANKDYFLQRILPYPMRNGNFEDEKELVAFIQSDVEEFRNAHKSSNYKTFVETTNKVQNIAEAMENMFLNYNVEGQSLEKIEKALSLIEENITEITSKAEKIKK